MSDALHLRPLQPSDRSAVEAIMRSSGAFRPVEIDLALEVFDAYAAQPERDYYALGGFLNSKMVAYACYGPTPCTMNTWDFYWIAVAGEQQHRGYGSMILREVERRVQQARGRLIVVETSGTAAYQGARSLYEGNGYTRVSRIADFYAPGDDQLVYTKHLQS